MGQWYSITIKAKGNTITILDSLKLLPFSVKKIGNSFNTKHKKLEMEYTGFRYAGCEITDEEKEYILNNMEMARSIFTDVLRVNENDKVAVYYLMKCEEHLGRLGGASNSKKGFNGYII